MDSIFNIDSVQDHKGIKAIVTKIAIGADIRQIANPMPTFRTLFAIFIPTCRFDIYYAQQKHEWRRNSLRACCHPTVIRLVSAIFTF